MKRARIIVAIALALLFGASLVTAFLQQSPVEVAREHCIESGFRSENLVFREFRRTGGLFGIGNRETVEFLVKGTDPPKKVVLELRQPVYFLPWKVLELREEVQ